MVNGSSKHKTPRTSGTASGSNPSRPVPGEDLPDTQLDPHEAQAHPGIPAPALSRPMVGSPQPKFARLTSKNDEAATEVDMSAASADASTEPWENRLFERIRNYFDGSLLPRLE